MAIKETKPSKEAMSGLYQAWQGLLDIKPDIPLIGPLDVLETGIDYVDSSIPHVTPLGLAADVVNVVTVTAENTWNAAVDGVRHGLGFKCAENVPPGNSKNTGKRNV